MALNRDDGEPVGAHRVLLLVRGTKTTDIDTVDDTLPMAQQTFKITSENVECLLSDPPVALTLVGYSDFKGMLAYRLDKEVALVMASAVDGTSPGSASDSARAMVVTVEHMQKVSQDEARRLTASMNAEWKSVLTVADTAALPPPLSPTHESYWTEERAKKLRRLQSEPMTPPRQKLGFDE